MINQDQFKELQDRVKSIEDYLLIPVKRMQLAEEELRTQDPEFWNDAKAAEAKMKDIRALKFWVGNFDELNALLGDLEVTLEFFREEMATEEEVDLIGEKLNEAIESLELKKMLANE